MKTRTKIFKMSYLQLIISIMLLMTVSSLWAQEITDVEYSGDMQTYMGGKLAYEGKYNVTTFANRYHLKQVRNNGIDSVIITRFDKNIKWTIARGQYVETVLPKVDINHLPDGATRSCVDGGLYENHPTVKCITTYNSNPLMHFVKTTWAATDLNNVIVHSTMISTKEDRNSLSNTEHFLKNIIVAPQAPILFELPDDVKPYEG